MGLCAIGGSGGLCLTKRLIAWGRKKERIGRPKVLLDFLSSNLMTLSKSCCRISSNSQEMQATLSFEWLRWLNRVGDDGCQHPGPSSEDGIDSESPIIDALMAIAHTRRSIRVCFRMAPLRFTTLALRLSQLCQLMPVWTSFPIIKTSHGKGFWAALLIIIMVSLEGTAKAE